MKCDGGCWMIFFNKVIEIIGSLKKNSYICTIIIKNQELWQISEKK